MSQYKGRLVKPSYAVRVRCRKGTAKLISLSCSSYWCNDQQRRVRSVEFTLSSELRRLNASGYMMR